MNLKDMACLVEAYDAIERIEDAVEMICGERIGDGALDKLMGVVEVMQRYSACTDEVNDPDHKKFWRIIEDTRFEPEERAKKLMGFG